MDFRKKKKRFFFSSAEDVLNFFRVTLSRMAFEKEGNRTFFIYKHADCLLLMVELKSEREETMYDV